MIDESSLVRESFAAYVATRPRYQMARHHRLICHALAMVDAGTIHRLMIFAPPRHGKSQLVSGFYPAWYLGSHPGSQVIFTAYSDGYARDWGRRVRDQVLDPEYQRHMSTRLRGDSSATDRFELTNGSRYFAVGVGGPTTGRGADRFIVDDPVKNAVEAQSPTYQQRAVDWYESVASTRLMPRASIVIIMTRWHENDLCGHLLRAEPGVWSVLRLPAMAEASDDPLGRSEGEPLWPEWYPVESFSSHRTKRWWSALYQQRPAPATGSLLKREWWRYYDDPPSSFDETLASWDLSFKGGSTSDYVVGQVWGRVGSDCYLLESVRERADFPRTVQLIVRQSDRWNGIDRPRITTTLVEDKANGPAVISTLRDAIPTVVGVTPDGGKTARAHAVSTLIESGHVHLPSNAIWLNEFLDECTSFPVGANDDQVDSMTQALSRMMTSSPQIDTDVLFNPRHLPRLRI